MKTRCPACGATNSLDALLGHGEASKAFVASLNLVGDLATPLVKYLGMFRSQNRELTFNVQQTYSVKFLEILMLNRLNVVITVTQLLRQRGSGQLTPCLSVVTKANCSCL